MKILIIGSGGREHALAWKIKQSPHCEKLYAAPGNGGLAQIAEIVPIDETQIIELADWAMDNKIGLTVVGPELPWLWGSWMNLNPGDLKSMDQIKKQPR